MRNLLTGLDVGTSKVCAIVGESLPDGQLATLGFGVAPCTGLRKGVVVNIEATVDAIKAAVEEAEKTSGVRVGSVVVGVAGPHIRGLNSHGIVAVRGGEVSSRDVDRVIDAARAVAIPLDRQVLHILPQQFAVDEQEGVREPFGMAGVRLEARIHIVTAAQSYGQNLTKCCERAGVTPSEMVFEPLASADAALFPEERELGVALIDIGGGTTDIIVFHGGAVMHTAVLPIGGNHLTSDVAAGLRTPISDAERLKIDVRRRDQPGRAPRRDGAGAGSRRARAASDRAPAARRNHRAADGRDFHDGAARADALGRGRRARVGRRAGRRHLAARGHAGTGRANLRRAGAARTSDQPEGTARRTDEADVHDGGRPAAASERGGRNWQRRWKSGARWDGCARG